MSSAYKRIRVFRVVSGCNSSRGPIPSASSSFKEAERRKNGRRRDHFDSSHIRRCR